ncbi:MAG: diaminopimelate epimerase [Bacteroidota bacterium]
MKTFFKYQGAGNDFILFDHLNGQILEDVSQENIAQLCDRRFGIGADGLMLLEPHDEYDFYMRYFNSDGRLTSMCGNGGRCIVAFAERLGYIDKEVLFLAVDGPHRAKITRPNWVELEMNDVVHIDAVLSGYFLDTGSPHLVQWRDEIESVDTFAEGRLLRNNDHFAPGGTNVNFACGSSEALQIATYERGVEAETLACGTGVTAAAIVAVQRSGKQGQFEVPVKAKGGGLAVKLHYDGQRFSNIWLCGPADFVFQGQL